MNNDEAEPHAAADASIELVVGPRIRDLAGFSVNRVWPTARRNLIGPFVFVDHMLSADLPAGMGLDVPPHPHIGLSTVTYLFEGELMHRDSLGVEALIRPGELNWMTAGRGITHSERSSPAARAASSRLHGMQTWVALPADRESCEPSFVHHPASSLPLIEHAGLALRIIAGEAFGGASPVETASRLFYVDGALAAGARLRLASELGERGAYIVSGSIRSGGRAFTQGQLLVFRNGADVEIEAAEESRVMLLGGLPLNEPRFIDWNFVSSSKDKITRAIEDWKGDRFAPVPRESGRMPLPGRPKAR